MPVTDNTQAPFTGVFKDSMATQNGIVNDNFVASWLGRTTIYALTFNGSYNWTEISGNSNYMPYWERWLNQHPGSLLIVSHPMQPPGATHAKGARGDYDSYFRSFAAKIRNAGLCDRVIIRLGWEFNGGWYPWAVDSDSEEDLPEHFAANYCRIVSVMQGRDGLLPPTSTTEPGKMPANLKFNWCGVRLWSSYNVARAYPGNTPAGTTVPADPLVNPPVSYPAYPGNDYVHYVGVDSYDKGTWSAIVGSETSNNNGLERWKKIAIDKGKPFCIPEWGLSTNPSGGNFDNPTFIQNMFNYIHNPAKNILFHCYFDVDASADGGSDHHISQGPGQPATVHPNAALKYRQLFTPPMPTRTNIGTITAATKADGLTVAGAGTGYSADNFYFTSRAAGTSDLFQVKLTSASVAAGESGIMLRQNITAGAVNAALCVSNGDLVFQSRTAVSGSTTSNTVATGVTYPIWLRLVRRGTAVTAYRSADGLNWTYVAAQTLTNLSGNGAIGVAVSSGSTSTLNTVGVDDVGVADLKLGTEGGLSAKIIQDNADAVYAGAWTPSTSLGSCYGADYHTISASAGTGSATYNPGLTGSGLYSIYLHWPSGKSLSYQAPITVTHAEGTASLTGNQEAGWGLWKYMGTYQMNTASRVIINNDPNGPSTAADAVMYVPLPGPAPSLPAPKTGVDIGAPAMAGSASYSSGVYTVSGAGADIAGTADQFHYVSQTLSGDQTLIARVTSLTNTSSDAKAGIMFRGGTGTAGNDLFVMITTSPGGSIKMAWRGSSGTVSYGSAISTGSSPSASTPKWLRIVKVGGTYKFYYATTTGVPASWTQVGGTLSISMGTVRGGILAHSKNAAAVATATFDNVTP